MVAGGVVIGAIVTRKLLRKGEVPPDAVSVSR
jgi:hypothetical protein